MAKKKLKPVSVAGIEFDALIDEQKTLAATIPTYPVEDGYPVSDTIINAPISIQMTLFVTNTPVTWLSKHGSSADRVKKICKQLENMWASKKLVKVVTTDAIYKDMGITSITIKKSHEIGYAREIQLQMQKVMTTKRKTVKIPKGILKAGTTKAKAGKASTSKSSKKSSSSSSSSKTNHKGSKNVSTKNASAKKSKSILYGIANKAGLV